MSNARDNILKRLRSRPQHKAAVNEYPLPKYNWNSEEKITRLTAQMQAVRTEVHRVNRNEWIDWLNSELPRRKLTRVLTGNTPEGQSFKKVAARELDVQHYTQTIDHLRTQLFNSIDVGITTTRGGIADTGSLILWPDDNEPRLLSLVPAVHIALLKAEEIFENFAQAVQQQQWNNSMPTNALLISGPSKTADIQQTLAYGIHGPRQLIVLILE